MSDNLISRQAAIEFIKNNSYTIKHNRNDVEKGMTLYGIIQALEYLPSVQPKTGAVDSHQAVIECGKV